MCDPCASGVLASAKVCRHMKRACAVRVRAVNSRVALAGVVRRFQGGRGRGSAPARVGARLSDAAGFSRVIVHLWAPTLVRVYVPGGALYL